MKSFERKSSDFDQPLIVVISIYRSSSNESELIKTELDEIILSILDCNIVHQRQRHQIFMATRCCWSPKQHKHRAAFIFLWSTLPLAGTKQPTHQWVHNVTDVLMRTHIVRVYVICVSRIALHLGHSPSKLDRLLSISVPIARNYIQMWSLFDVLYIFISMLFLFFILFCLLANGSKPFERMLSSVRKRWHQ